MPLEVFYSYSHKDVELRAQLETHLSQLVHDGLIQPWTDRCIQAGTDWDKEIDERIKSAHIILLLISPDFLASEYAYGREMKIALDRHEKEQTVVVPIILRPCDWHSAPFARLQALPRQALAVTLWPNQDEAFANIAQCIRETVVRFQQPPAARPAEGAVSDQLIPRARVMDAAIPSHIVKERATELLVLIRLPESEGLAGILQKDDEAEASPEDVRSRPFEIVFPLGPLGRPEPLKLTIQVTSPDFDPPLQVRNLFVPVERDSPVCHFLLTPKKTGPLLVVIELMWEDAEQGNRRLKTTCVADAEMPVQVNRRTVVQMPIGVKAKAHSEVHHPPARRAPSAKASGPSVIASAPGRPASPSLYPLSPAAQAAPPPSPAARAAPPGIPSQAKLSGRFVSLKAVGFALGFVVLGSSFFLFQNSHSSAPPTPTASAVPVPQTPSDANLQRQIEAAEIELKKASQASSVAGSKQSRSPETVALIEKSETTLAAARAALARGDQAQAKQKLAVVRATNRDLRIQELKASPAREPIH